MEIKELDAAILGVGNIAEKGERVFLYSPDEEIAYFLLHQESTATDERATTPQLPSELDSESAKKYFAKAVGADLMTKQYKWLKTKALLAWFCSEMSKKLDLGKGEIGFGQKRISWKPFEQLFNVKKGSLRGSLNDIQKTGRSPIGKEKVEAIFKD